MRRGSSRRSDIQRVGVGPARRLDNYADKGYTDYDHEELLEEVGLYLKAQRKKNLKRPMAAWEEFLGKPIRQYMEIVFSRLRSFIPKKIHAVTP